MITNIRIICTMFTRKTQTYVNMPTRTAPIRGDGVGVLGAGGRGDHATATNAG